MTRTHNTLAIVAAAALAGCNQGQTNAAADEANAALNAAPIELPPAIVASKIYRCKDNSVIYIDWLSDKKSANVRTEKNGPATHVMAPEEDQPMVAEGWSLTGAATDASISLTRPGAGSSTCNA